MTMHSTTLDLSSIDGCRLKDEVKRVLRMDVDIIHLVGGTSEQVAQATTIIQSAGCKVAYE